MNRTFLAVFLCGLMAVGAATAGSLSDPVVAPEVIAADAASDASAWAIVIASLVIMATVVASQ